MDLLTNMVKISDLPTGLLARKGTRAFPTRVTTRDAALLPRSRSLLVAASRGIRAVEASAKTPRDGCFPRAEENPRADASRPGASRLFDEAFAKGTNQKLRQSHATEHAIATHARVALTAQHVVPMAAAAAAAAAVAGASLLRRKREKGWAKADVQNPSSSPLLPAATASGEAAWMDPEASPAPRLDIAGDAFSAFAAGEDVKANASRPEKENATAERNASLEAELADLELDLAAFEAALKSGGKALRRAKATENTPETGPDTATPGRTGGDDAPGARPAFREADGSARRSEKHENAAAAFSEAASASASSAFEPPPSASTAWWDVDIDERAYRPTSARGSADAETREAEKRRRARKARRVSYFRTNISVRAASVLVSRRAEADVLARLAPSSPLDARVFDSRAIGAAAYGVALAALCKEQNLGDVRGEGTFSDVYGVEPASAAPAPARLGDWAFAGVAAPGFDDEPPRFCAAESDFESGAFVSSSRRDAPNARPRDARAVIKCSTPFPGVVNGKAVGDGLRIGETEARILASLPRHPNVVRLLAAFLSAERNESYLLLGDAGTNLHAMRERGEVSPRDVRRHARVVLGALAHCHAHGVVHRDVKGGNVLVDDAFDSPFPRATLIDFGVARHVSVVDTEPASRYGTPGYQAPELLMSDMSAAEHDVDLYAKVDVFALGCTLFFLCVGKELFGATPGEEGAEFGARTKTKARAQATQDAVEAALEKAGAAAEPDGASADLGVEEGMVVRRREKRETRSDGRTGNFAAAALARALGGAAARAELESRETERELDALMLRSMAEFPGYEPRTPEEVAFVERACGAPAPPAPPAHRESLAAFVKRKVTPRQPAGFASLIGACLARDPEDRPSAAEALNWPGAWVELDDEESGG